MADTSDTAEVKFKQTVPQVEARADLSERQAQTQSRQAAAQKLLKAKGGDMSTEEYLATRAVAGGKGAVLAGLGSGALAADTGGGRGATGTTGTAEAPTYDFTGVLNLLAARAGRS